MAWCVMALVFLGTTTALLWASWPVLRPNRVPYCYGGWLGGVMQAERDCGRCPFELKCLRATDFSRQMGPRIETNAKRIYDNPNHPQYGPVRRMWVVLSQLDLLEAAERFATERGDNWDDYLARLCRMGLSEPYSQRIVLGAISRLAD